eukprot:GFUD01044229.1.p1 GENE.GFUD01044229.1~~GFUD01044229.1.p1  ORF type:complete len:621 (-),score=161.15 GFUD01044229.1:106-1968(-)
MTSPPLLLLVISLIPYVYLTESKTYTKSSSPPRTYYYRKITPSPTPPASSSPPASFLEKLLYKKVSTLAGWMDSATSKYFPYVPHSGKYSGEENPLTGDSYPWSKKTGKYRASRKKSKTSTESSSPPAKSAKSLPSVDDTMDGILPLPRDLSDYWKSQLVSSDVEDQDSATGKDSVQMSDAEYDYETEDENSSRLLFSAPSVEGEDSATGKKIVESVAGSSSSIEHSPSKNMDSVKIDDAKYDHNSEDSAPSVEASSMEESKARMASSQKLKSDMEELINFVYSDKTSSSKLDYNMEEMINLVYTTTRSEVEDGTSTSSSVFKNITKIPGEKTFSEGSLPSSRNTQPFFRFETFMQDLVNNSIKILSKKEEVPIKLLVPEMVKQDIITSTETNASVQMGDAAYDYDTGNEDSRSLLFAVPEAEQTPIESNLPAKQKTQPYFSKNEEVPVKLLVPELSMQDNAAHISKSTETNTNDDEDSEGVVAYLVSDASNPGSEFLVTRSALFKSGVVHNKKVSLSAWAVDAAGQVEIVNSNTFHLTGLSYDGPVSGPAMWMVGSTFPIRLQSSTTVLSSWIPGMEEINISLPDQMTVSDISWLALYCSTCVEGEKVIMQVYVPETFL